MCLPLNELSGDFDGCHAFGLERDGSRLQCVEDSLFACRGKVEGLQPHLHYFRHKFHTEFDPVPWIHLLPETVNATFLCLYLELSCHTRVGCFGLGVVLLCR